MANKLAVSGSRNDVPVRFQRCIIHIGTEKTGSSTIQQFLSQNRKKFAKQGVLYPECTGTHGGTQWAFPALAHPESWKTDIGLFLDARTQETMQAYLAKFEADLAHELESAQKRHTLIISSEHLQSRLGNPKHIETLKAFLSKWADRFEIVVYLRRQDRMAISFYSTKLKSGNDNPPVFPDMPKSGLLYYFNFEKLYQNWSQVFGAAAMKVRIFDQKEMYDHDLISDFCQTTGLNGKGKERPSQFSNTSLTQEASQFLLEANRQMPNIVDGRRNSKRDEFSYDVSRLFPGKYYPTNQNEAQIFQAQFLESNERLRKLAFPDRDKPLFDDDFSDYPEQVPSLPADCSKLVANAIVEWNQHYEDENSRSQILKKAIESLEFMPTGDSQGLNETTVSIKTPPFPTLADRPPLAAEPSGPLVSVVMPSFDQKDFISRSIESVLGQSHTNLELIISDGGSTDGTVELLNEYAKRDSRIRWTSEPDNGPADAINKALSKTRGTLIGWLNSDDLYTSDAISRAVATFSQTTDAIMVYGEGLHINANDEVIDRYPTHPPETGIQGFREGCFICQPTVFFKKTMHRLLGPLDEGFKASFDFDYWLRAFKAFPGRIEMVDEVQALSRLHDACITKNERERVAVEGIRVLSRHLGKAPAQWFYTYMDEVTANPPEGTQPEQLRMHLHEILQKVQAGLSPRDVETARLLIERLGK